MLIDDKIIIDPSEDIFELEESFMLSGLCDGVKDVIITHSHLGHFSACAIEHLAKKNSGLRVYAGAELRQELSEISGIEPISIYPFGIFKLCDYEVIPLPSNHVTEKVAEIPFNFLFRKEKTFFYGLDGGFINPSAWRVLRQAKPELLIIDCALGNLPTAEGCIYHNNLDSALKLRELLISCQSASESTRFILSHLPSEKRRELHEELTALVVDYPSVRIAYDGYYVTL